MYDIIKFETIRNKLTASGYIIHSFLNYKLMVRSEFYGYLKSRKKSKLKISKKKLSEKVSQPLKNELFSKNLSAFN